MSGGGGEVRMALPRPGPVLRGLLVTIGALGIGLAAARAGGVDAFFNETATTEILKGEVWRLVTSGFLTSPVSFEHLFWTLLGLYFLSPELEKRWGGARFLRFFLLAVVLGNVASIATALAFNRADESYFGASAALAAIAVAFAREFPDVTFRLFFFLPMRGKALAWITIGFAALGLVYPTKPPEGTAAPFAGIVAGYLLAGNPSPIRALYLKMRLGLLRRQAKKVGLSPDPRAAREGTEAKPRRGRTPSPPLRVVYGGLEEELKKRKPPKDKRYLN